MNKQAKQYVILGIMISLVLIFGTFIYVQAIDNETCVQHSNYKECEINGKKSLEVYEYKYKDDYGKFESYKNNIELKVENEEIKIELKDKFKITLNPIPTLNGIDSTWSEINSVYPDIRFNIPVKEYKDGKIKFDLNLTNGGLMGENIPSNVGLILKLEDKTWFLDTDTKILDDGLLFYNEFKLWIPEGCADITKDEIVYTTLDYYCLDPSLEVGSSVTLGGNHNYDTVLVHSNGTITLNESYLNITATNWIKIYGTINGYALQTGGSGPGGDGESGTGGDGGGGGGGHVGLGGAGGAGEGGSNAGGTAGNNYGNNNIGTLYTGSLGGKHETNSGGRGGISLGLRSTTIIVNGSIIMTGEAGYDATGAGSGGTIFMIATDLTLNDSNLYVFGGAGGNALNTNDGGGGGGSGGRIKLFYEDTFLNGSMTINKAGGTGGTKDGSGIAGGNGATGVYYVNQTSDLGFDAEPLVTINSPTNITYSTNSIIFNVTAIDDIAMDSCWYSLDSGLTNYTMTNATANDYNATNSSMTQNSHTVNFYCNDTSNNINNTESVDFSIDSIHPQISIVYPVNSTHYNINISTLNYTFVETHPDSCWYSKNDGITNSSIVSMGTNFTGIISIKGQNNWTLFCNDTTGNENFTIVSFNKFIMDINLISPINNTTLITTASNFTANYTISSGDLKNTTYYIWYENSTIFNQTLVDISGTTNETTFSTNGFKIGTYLWNTLVCAEDSGTYCFFNEVNYTLLIGVSVGDKTFANWTYETAEQSFSVNLTLVEDTSLVSANLVYNNTKYAISNISIDGNEYILHKVIDTPLNPYYFSNVSNEFYWSFTYIDRGGTQSSQNTTTHEQNVTYLVINICNATYNLSDSHALNFTIYDELTTDRINATSNATTLRTTFNYWIGSGSVYKNYSYSNLTNNATGEYNFCISPRNETLYSNMDMEYGAVDYSTRKYYLRNAPLDNVTNNIKLELLPDSDSVKFFIKVREGMVGFPDATVTINKYFTGEGVYRTTEIRETDVNGKFVAYLDLDQTYNFLVVKEGVSYGTITAQALCTESPCELTLQIEEAVTNMWQGFYDEFAASVSYTLSYNDTLKLVTYTFNDLTGLAQSFALDVSEIEYDVASGFVLEPSGTYCNKTLSAVTGTLTCNLTDYTKGDFKATGYISRSPAQIVDYITFIISSVKDTLGNLGLFVSFLLIVVIGLVGCWNPVVGVVLTTFAVLMMKILGFVAFSYTTVILIIIMAIILAFKMKS
ncbi:hypothetical protein ES702_01254 [subsurface metagenome]